MADGARPETRTDAQHETQPAAGVRCPFSLSVDPIARFMNAELVDDPTYDAFELQWFDDAAHGTGMLAFLSRREDRRVDYYVAPGLDLDREGYAIGGGTGVWTETAFERAHLVIADDGVDVDVRFVDRDGRVIEICGDDRDGRPRRRGRLLAPVGSTIDDPNSLLLVHLHGFDLVRRAAADQVVVSIDGRRASTGALPGRRLHGHELIKYAGPLQTIMVNRELSGPVPVVPTASGVRLDGGAVAELIAGEADHRVRLAMRPAVPDPTALADGDEVSGAWRVSTEGVPPLTGGTWRLVRRADEVHAELDVTERWRPGPLPWLMRTVTRVLPVFRTWPTTYRWTATITLGEAPTMVSRWERTGERDDGYRRATGSAT